ncbi:damage-inducible protein J [Lactobacillus sp. XV13L]|nr:damage-inducible protein J [Lactobacillus sp. XV13L]
MDRIEARIDSATKNKAKEILANHGLTISEFARMTITTVANNGLPKYYSLPNQELSVSLQEVADDLSGKEKLPEAHSFAELEEMLNSDE